MRMQWVMVKPVLWLTRTARRQVLGKMARQQECVLVLTRIPRLQVLGMSPKRPASSTSSVLFSMGNIGLMFLFFMGNVGLMFYMKTPSGLATVCRRIEHVHMVKMYHGSCSDRSDVQPVVLLHAREAHVHLLQRIDGRPGVLLHASEAQNQPGVLQARQPHVRPLR
ncbi:uncharacterized protein [Triticum aestivum]|uniref:uncharacterized protein n=2 Tax=Triticum aestivum TaxID=4565 RepID=UPI001D02C282|nr:uncharacterized protein LOC123059738 [Triticum aestivum]